MAKAKAAELEQELSYEEKMMIVSKFSEVEVVVVGSPRYQKSERLKAINRIVIRTKYAVCAGEEGVMDAATEKVVKLKNLGDCSGKMTKEDIVKVNEMSKAPFSPYRS